MPEHPYIRTEGDLVYAITQEALDGCAARAAGSVDGMSVAGHRLRRSRGASVSVDGGSVSARLEVSCRYGVPIPDAAHAVQREVAAALATLTGLDVARVDVEVVGVTRT
jgi:uncharacterized alkaline shock family protein YloU